MVREESTQRAGPRPDIRAYRAQRWVSAGGNHVSRPGSRPSLGYRQAPGSPALSAPPFIKRT